MWKSSPSSLDICLSAPLFIVFEALISVAIVLVTAVFVSLARKSPPQRARPDLSSRNECTWKKNKEGPKLCLPPQEGYIRQVQCVNKRKGNERSSEDLDLVKIRREDTSEEVVDREAFSKNEGTMSTKGAQEWAVPIPKRTAPTNYLQTGVFAVFFNTTILVAHFTQYLAVTLYPLPATRPYYEKTIAYTKLAFGRILMAINQLFGPTKLVISCSDAEGNAIDPESIVKRRKDGSLSHIELPRKSVWISNHQVYTDWLYLWCLAYYGDLADSILIILKDSLKWIPFIGWGMQFFRFIFLARNWNADKGPLAKHLAFMASKARSAPSATMKDGSKSSESATDLAVARSSPSKLLLLVFPEGTLVSELTRPTSKKFAEKQEMADCRNLLLPRSTGLLFCLRSLAADIPDLKLLDFTIGYPGIPPQGYGQSYYTLRSIFMQGVPPPAVHIHFTVLPARATDPQDHTSPPLGKLPTSAAEASKQESSPEEKAQFEAWLLKRWRDKDDLMDRFYRDGDFVGGQYGSAPSSFNKTQDAGKQPKGDRRYVEVPVHLRSVREFGDIICWGAPLWTGFFVYKAIQWMR